jgi:hypothetical protein
MYGMVNQGVRGLVLSRFGEEAWTRIHTQAAAPATFLNFEQYDDAVTYNLVGAAAEVLELPAEAVLRTFGLYWVTDIAVKSYGDLMNRSGISLVDFLKNLDHMHTRIKVSFPNYRPPSFRVKELSDDELELDYYSEREGLLPFVEGLLAGLALHFHSKIDIVLVPDTDHPMPCQRMRLRHVADGSQ